MEVILKYDPETGLAVLDETHGVHTYANDYFLRKISVDPEFVERYRLACEAWNKMHEELEARWDQGRLLTAAEIIQYDAEMKQRYADWGVSESDCDTFIELNEHGEPL